MMFPCTDGPLPCLNATHVDLTTSNVDRPVSAPPIAERLRRTEKAEVVGELVGGLAHDFNNLLGVIVGSLDRAVRILPADASASRYVADALMATDRAVALVGRLLAFVRQQPLFPKVVEIDGLMLGLKPLIDIAMPGCTIVLDLACSWQGLVDANQFENAILNLAVNARDAMPAGGRLTITTRRLSRLSDEGSGDASTDHVLVTVSDTGTGMTAEVCASALKPLFTTKALQGGTGLGLSQVGSFIVQCGGTMRIESEVGTGTTVSLELPRAVLPIRIGLEST